MEETIQNNEPEEEVYVYWDVKNTVVGSWFGVNTHKKIWLNYFTGKFKRIFRLFFTFLALITEMLTFLEVGVPLGVSILACIVLMLYFLIINLLLLDMKIVRLVMKTSFFWLNFGIVCAAFISLGVNVEFDYRCMFIIPTIYGMGCTLLMDAYTPTGKSKFFAIAYSMPILVMLFFLIALGLSRIPRFNPQTFYIGDFGGAATNQVQYSIGQLTISLFFTAVSISTYNMLHLYYHPKELQSMTKYLRAKDSPNSSYLYPFLQTETANVV